MTEYIKVYVVDIITNYHAFNYLPPHFTLLNLVYSIKLFSYIRGIGKIGHMNKFEQVKSVLMLGEYQKVSVYQTLRFSSALIE